MIEFVGALLVLGYFLLLMSDSSNWSDELSNSRIGRRLRRYL